MIYHKFITLILCSIVMTLDRSNQVPSIYFRLIKCINFMFQCDMNTFIYTDEYYVHLTNNKYIVHFTKLRD